MQSPYTTTTKGHACRYIMFATNGGECPACHHAILHLGTPSAVLMRAFGVLLISAAQRVSSIHYALHAALLTEPAFRLQNLLT